MNEVPDERGSSVHQVEALALCTMVRNEAPYMLEWLMFHHMFGVELFRIYDNGSDDGTFELLELLSRSFPIELVRWSQTGIGKQAAAFEDCAAALAGRVGFVGFIDADEFLFDPDFRQLPAALAEFGPDVGAIGVNQRVFGSSGHATASDELVTLRFIQRAADDCPEHRWFKTLARPEAVEGFDTQHAVRLRAGAYVLGDGASFGLGGKHPGQSDRIASRGLRLHHYILKSLEEFRQKQRRGAVSDRPEVGFRRFTDSYFEQRERYANAVQDEILTKYAVQLRAAVREIDQGTSGFSPQAPSTNGFSQQTTGATQMGNDGFSTAQYWETRYRTGGNSGAGSRGRLGAFKTHMVNQFVIQNRINGVVEFGCGDGNLLSMLSLSNYVGVDVSETALAKCRTQFASTPGYRFVNYDQLADVDEADLVLSIDVIFHLLEDDLFERYMQNLFTFSRRFVAIYSSNHDTPATQHIRHHNVTAYVARHFPEWHLVAHVPNIYPFSANNTDHTSFCDWFIFRISNEPCVVVVPPPVP